MTRHDLQKHDEALFALIYSSCSSSKCCHCNRESDEKKICKIIGLSFKKNYVKLIYIHKKKSIFWFIFFFISGFSWTQQKQLSF